MLAAGCTEEPDTPPAQQGRGSRRAKSSAETISDANDPSLETTWRSESSADAAPKTAGGVQRETRVTARANGEGDGEAPQLTRQTDQEARGEGAEACACCPRPLYGLRLPNSYSAASACSWLQRRIIDISLRESGNTKLLGTSLVGSSSARPPRSAFRDPVGDIGAAKTHPASQHLTRSSHPLGFMRQ